MGEPDLESNRRKNLILQRISDYFYVSDNLTKWSITVLMKEAPHKSTMRKHYYVRFTPAL